MKTLKIVVMSTLLAVAGQAVAKPAKQSATPITFTKGSYCSSYEGDIKNRNFSLQTKAKQRITIKLDTFENINRFHVKDPSGRLLKDVGTEHWEFDTKTAGKHTISVKPHDNSGRVIHAKFEVCVR